MCESLHDEELIESLQIVNLGNMAPWGEEGEQNVSPRSIELLWEEVLSEQPTAALEPFLNT